MKKLKTLFKKDPTNLGRVINELDETNLWAIGDGIATRKFDGTSCAIINNELYKRYDLKPGRTLPPNAIPCQEPDIITKHHPHWIKCDRADNSNKYHFIAFDKLVAYYSQEGFNDFDINGTYELCGEKIQRNPENITGHILIKHGQEIIELHELNYYNAFDVIKDYLTNHDIEGIVFHHKTDGRMCKIRKTDFGIKRKKTTIK